MGAYTRGTLHPTRRGGIMAWNMACRRINDVALHRGENAMGGEAMSERFSMSDVITRSIVQDLAGGRDRDAIHT